MNDKLQSVFIERREEGKPVCQITEYSNLIDPSLKGGDVEGGGQVGCIRCDVHPAGDWIK